MDYPFAKMSYYGNYNFERFSYLPWYLIAIAMIAFFIKVFLPFRERTLNFLSHKRF